ncbi:MAG: PepSY domain-containing protein [Candidatus Competibacter sp.]|nr:PepSY domain-containing protein [Candidatus Competibacter sp.]MDS4070434.1 PepSY domain-containing protein [Candidatus Competibacter sp.]
MIVRNPPLAAIALALAATFATISFAQSKDAAPAASQPAAAREITKEQAVEMALKAHPGKVTKAYEDTKKGKKTWEVKIDGNDGKKWEVYYEIKTGELVAEEGK